TRFGSASHWVLQLFLRKWGMRSEDIQMVQLGSSPAMFASLEKGAVDGAVFTIPTFFVAEDRGYRILADPVDLDIYYLQNSVDSTKSLLRQKHDQAVRFVKGICEGLAYFKKNKKESLAVLQKKLRIQSVQEKDFKYLEASYNLLATKFYNQVPYAMPKAVETTLDFVATEEPKARGADPKLFTDESIVREVEASGFIKTLYEKITKDRIKGATMAVYKKRIYEKHRGGVLITPKRPAAKNGISRKLIKELHEALDEVDADPEI